MQLLAAVLALFALPRVLTLEEALRIFRERSFDLLIAQAAVESAQGDLEIASAVYNPQLSGSAGRSFNYDSSQCAGCSNVQLSAGLSDQGALFDAIVNKRGLRKDVARAALEAARLSRAEAQRTLEFQLKQQFLQAALAAEQARFAGEVRQSTGRTRELMERRFAAGAVSEADLAKVQVAELEAMQQLELDTSALGWRPGARSPGGLDSLFHLALENRPDLLALDREVQRAEAALALARRERFPEVALSATSYTQRLWTSGEQGLVEGARLAAERGLRPVLMTASVAMIGLLPAAVSTGIGSETQKPLAIVVIGGALFLALFPRLLQPALLVLLHRRDRRYELARAREPAPV